MKCLSLCGNKLELSQFGFDITIASQQIKTLCEEGPYGSSKFFSCFDDYEYGAEQVEKLGCWILWDNEVAGVLLGRIIFDEAEVIHVVVSPSFRGKGNGSILFENFEKTLRKMKVKKVFLEVGCNNLSAKSLYKKIGFSEISVRKKYYRGVEDAFVMEKFL